MGWQILEDLGRRQIQREIDLCAYPKWSSLCLLRQARLPVLRACCVRPDSTERELEEALRNFSARIGSTRLLVRSDGGRERSPYFIGGNTLSDDRLFMTTRSLLREGRAVILLESTDRLRNRLTASIGLDRGTQFGHIVIEILGPGFDVGDLTRGGLTPAATIVWQGVKWTSYERPLWSDLNVWYERRPAALQTKRDERMSCIGQRILVAAGLTPRSLDASETEDWLRSHGYIHLWQALDGGLVASNLHRWIDDAQFIASIHPNRRWASLCLTFSDLGDGRCAYWDVVDAHGKFAW